MKSLPIKVQFYIFSLFIITALAAIISVYRLYSLSLILSSSDFLYLLIETSIFILSIFIFDLYPIRLLTEGNAEVTISCAFKTAAVLVFVQHSPYIAIIVTLFGTLFAELAMGRTWYKALFNVAEMTLTSACMGLVYQLIYDSPLGPFASLRNGLGVCAMMLTYGLVNTGLVTIVVSLTRRISFLHVWKANFLDVIWNLLTIIPVGAVMASLWLKPNMPWALAALILPLIVVRRSFQFIVELQEQTQDTLIRMADAIDQRDPSTYQHSQRVANLSEAIAQEMGLPEEYVETIRMAARLHDLGKIGMSNDLLFKPGRFDEDERAEFQRHPTIGAELVNSFRLFKEGQNLIKYHHERYDGKGYPQGLQGEDIPLGSRILAVADSFDAMTSWRVYRPSLSLDDAKKELLRNKGSQFDADVVDVFNRIIERQDKRIPIAFQPSYSSEMVP